MPAVVVTGGAGFIGSHTVEELLRIPEVEVIVVDNFHSGSHKNLKSSGRVRVLNSDIRALNDLKLDPRDLLGVVHLAAIVSLDEAYSNPKLTLETNVIGTLNVLEMARKLDTRRFVYASSVAVYGEPVKLPIDEDHPTNPSNIYGLSKLMGEQLAMRYMQDYGIEVISLRYFNVYGPRMRSGPYSGVIHRFITALLSGGTVRIFGDGSQTRDFVYVEDVAEANVRALLSGAKGMFNIGTGVETSIKELLSLLCEVIGVTAHDIKYESPRKGDVRRSRASYEAAKVSIGWEPRTSLKKGLERTVRWYIEA
ncbi:MAG: NAD-dependent epimerase/dehydratase family protein [Candidatus Korarchaeum sp.]|nr:NAD-dependent epimerase/dehydratase family protein [Candidatus Korarchaeum sp.]MDW8035641.1 NAD-dependent epimerase/dehydratase family protein [Candidatus Korarchaeum sp.]